MGANSRLGAYSNKYGICTSGHLSWWPILWLYTTRRHRKSPREKIQRANNPVTQRRDCRVCLSICSVFPLRRVLKSQQCLHIARRDKICILNRQLPFVLGGHVGVKFLQAIWLWNRDIRQLKWRQSTQRRIETDSGTNQDRIHIQLIKWLPTQYLKRRGLKSI